MRPQDFVLLCFSSALEVCRLGLFTLLLKSNKSAFLVTIRPIFLDVNSMTRVKTMFIRMLRLNDITLSKCQTVFVWLFWYEIKRLQITDAKWRVSQKNFNGEREDLQSSSFLQKPSHQETKRLSSQYSQYLLASRQTRI